MFQSHRTPKQNFTTGSCYTTLLVAVAPIAIYVLQLLGKISTPAACLAGILIITKALVEWHVAMRRLVHPQSNSLQSHKKPATQRVLVPYKAPVAGCYYCQRTRSLRAYPFEAGQKVGVCQDCYCTLEMSRHRR